VRYVECLPPYFPSYPPSIDPLFASEYVYPVYEILSGIASAAQNLFRSNVTYSGVKDPTQYNEYSGPRTDFFGSLAMQFLLPESPSLQGHKTYFALNFEDPTSYILSVLDEIMFRAAIDTAFNNTLESANWFWEEYHEDEYVDPPLGQRGDLVQYNLTAFPKPQLITMQETRIVQVFESHYRFPALAMGVIFLAVLVLAPILNGFWTLGRKTSLSPLETAKAFGAPLLADGGSNVNARQLLEELDLGPVKYGEVLGAVNGIGNGEVRRRRLGIAAADQVMAPDEDTLYS
jgi:hypothetical protein